MTSRKTITTTKSFTTLTSHTGKIPFVNGFIGYNPIHTFCFPGLTKEKLEAGKVFDTKLYRVKMMGGGVIVVIVLFIKLDDGKIIPSVFAENQLTFLSEIMKHEVNSHAS